MFSDVFVFFREFLIAGNHKKYFEIAGFPAIAGDFASLYNSRLPTEHFGKNMGNMGLFRAKIWGKYGILSEILRKIWDIYGTYLK